MPDAKMPQPLRRLLSELVLRAFSRGEITREEHRMISKSIEEPNPVTPAQMKREREGERMGRKYKWGSSGIGGPGGRIRR